MRTTAWQLDRVLQLQYYRRVVLLFYAVMLSVPAVCSGANIPCPAVCGGVCPPGTTNSPSEAAALGFILSQSRNIHEYQFNHSGGSPSTNPGLLPACSLPTWAMTYRGVQVSTIALAARALLSQGDTWTARSLLRSVDGHETNSYATTNGSPLCAMQNMGYKYFFYNLVPLGFGECFHFDWVSSAMDYPDPDNANGTLPFPSGEPALQNTVQLGLSALALDARLPSGASLSAELFENFVYVLEMMQVHNLFAESPQKTEGGPFGQTAAELTPKRSPDHFPLHQADEQQHSMGDENPTFHPLPPVHTLSVSLEMTETDEPNTTTTSTTATPSPNTTTAPTSTTTTMAPTTVPSTTTSSTTTTTETAEPVTTTTESPTSTTYVESSTASVEPSTSTTTAPPPPPSTSTQLPTEAPTTASPLPPSTVVPTDTTSTSAPSSTTVPSSTATPSTPSPNTTSPTPVPPAPTQAPNFHAQMATQLLLHSWMRGFSGFEERFPGTLTPTQSRLVGTVWNQTNQSISQWFCSAESLAPLQAHPYIPFSVDLISLEYNNTNDAWTQCIGLAAVGTLLDDRCDYYSLSFKVLDTVMHTFSVYNEDGDIVGIAATQQAQRQGVVDQQLTGFCAMAAKRLQAAYLPSFITEIDTIVSGLTGNSSTLVQEDCERLDETFPSAGAFDANYPTRECGGPLLSLRMTVIRFMALDGTNPFEVIGAFPTPPPLPQVPPQGSPETVNVAIGGAVGGVVVLVALAVVFRRVRRAPQSEVLLQAPTENLGFY